VQRKQRRVVMLDHKIRELVSELTAVATSHKNCQSLRQALSRVVSEALAEEDKPLALFTCTDFTAHYPVGGAIITIASTYGQALANIERVLKADGLEQHIEANQVKRLSVKRISTRLLANGDY